MAKKLSPVGEVCSLLQVSPAELAEYLHIDKTTVSKWRTGARVMKKNSVYLEELAEYLIYTDKQLLSKPLYHFLSDKFPSEDLNHKDSLMNCLKQFLISDTQPALHNITDVTHTSQHRLLLGAEGKKEALSMLLDIAEQSSSTCNIKILEPEQINWVYHDVPFLRMAMQRLERLINQGHHLDVAYYSGNDTPEFRIFIRLFENISFAKNLKVHTIYDDKHTGILPSIYGIENHVVAVGLFEPSTPANLVTNLFFDPFNNEKYLTLFNTVTDKLCNPILLTDISNIKEQIIKKIEFTVEREEPLYSFSEHLSITTMSESLLKEILEQNNCDKEEQRQCLLYYKTLRNAAIGKSIASYYYISMNILERALSYEFLIESELTALLKRQITKTASQYRRHLNETVSFITSYNHVKIYLVPGYQQKMLHANTWIKKNLWCLSFNSLCVPYEYQMLYYDDLSLVKMAADMCEQTTKDIPGDFTNKEHVLTVLSKLGTGRPL